MNDKRTPALSQRPRIPVYEQVLPSQDRRGRHDTEYISCGTLYRDNANGRFLGYLKRENYYGKRFIDKQDRIRRIDTYILYYNTKRVQRNRGILTPMEKHNLAVAAKKNGRQMNLPTIKILYFFIVLLTGSSLINVRLSLCL
uniref:IS3 family transposase n=1 Tax=Selenomonas sp. TAMA-11512 TaxID=3095337 RepID=UPI00403F1F85